METVIMRGQISGGWFVDNGDGTSTHHEYPGPGQPLRTDAGTAARLLAQGMATRPDQPSHDPQETPAPAGNAPAEDVDPPSRTGRRR